MKKLENILLKASGFTILILMLFYMFALSGNLTPATIAFPTFLLIFFFGVIISVATMILGLKQLKLPIRLLIHYTTLLVAFCSIFIASGNIQADSAAKIFSAVVIFTVLYALFFATVYLIKRTVNLIDKKIDEKQNKGAKSAAKKSGYKSIYSDK